MPSETYNIDSIERYLTHQMDSRERADFEAQMSQDEGYRRELAAYQRALEGFQAQRGEQFREQMNKWEQEWAQANTDDNELIEWYLTGELQGEARSRVEKRIKEDQAFAGEVAAYRQVHQGLEAARTEAFRHKMKEWEKDKSRQPALQLATRRPLWRQLAAAAAILLLLGFGFNWYLQANFNNGAIAEAFYQPPIGGATMGGEPTAQEVINQGFKDAHNLFRQQQFSAAYQAFDTLLGQLDGASIDELSRSYYREQSEWNRLLAALAMKTPPLLNVQTEAQRIATTDGHEFQEQARALLRKLDTPWYKWVN